MSFKSFTRNAQRSASHWMRTRSGYVVGIFAAVVLLCGFLLPIVRPNEGDISTHFYCTKCGLRKHVLEEWQGSQANLTETTDLQATALSNWFEQHYDGACEHSWNFNHFVRCGRFRLGSLTVNTAGAASSSATPPIIWLQDDDRKSLDSLYLRSSEDCRDYIESRLTRELDSDANADPNAS